MSTSQNFTNEFRVRQVPQTLDIISIFHDQQRYKGTKFDYSASALAAAEMTRITGKPFASLGASVVTISGSTAPKMVKVIVKANGMPVDTVITSGEGSAISPDAQGYLESLSRLINRQINVAMIGAGFRQNGRHFFGKKPVELGSIFHMFRGAYISAKAFSAKSALVIVDPAVEYRSSHTLLDALKNELKRRGIQNWRDASGVSGEINASFSSRAARLRSVYSEVVGSHADPEYNVYRFGEFDFSAGVGDGVDQTRSPLSFHKRFGREVSPDQPVVRVFAKGGFEVSHAPELLEVQPSTESLKRVSSQFSKKAAAMALMNSQDRYYSSIEYASPLVASGLIEKEPRRVAVQYCGPVVLAVEDDYINVKTNLDFRKFYKKGKVLVKPIIESFHVFHNAHDSPLALPLIKTIGQVFSEFVVNLPNPHFHSDSPDDPNEFSNYLIDSAIRERFGRHDLVVAIDDMNDPSADEFYNRVKGFSLFDQVFPTQFFETASIEAQMEKDLKSNLVYSAFPQIVAKLGGIPFGLRPGFAPPGSVFIGLDRYHDSFSPHPSTNASVAIFDDKGNYVSANAMSFDSSANDRIFNIGRLLDESLRLVSSRNVPIKTIYFLRDTGLGQMGSYLEEEAEQAEKASKSIGAKSVFIAANKGSHLRLYEGDPSNPLMASRTPPFNVVREMDDPAEFVVISTEPIFEKAAQRELGTPRPVLYHVIRSPEGSNGTEVKETASRAVAWLCRHSWVSPSSTRLPVPLDYAHKLAHLVGLTGKPLSPQAGNAPLFV